MLNLAKIEIPDEDCVGWIYQNGEPIFQIQFEMPRPFRGDSAKTIVTIEPMHLDGRAVEVKEIAKTEVDWA